MYVAGIDTGSVATKVVILDGNKKLVVYKVVSTPPAEAVAEKAFNQCLIDAKLSRKDITNIIATGYGRINVSFANKMRTEILCHSAGINYLFPSVRTIIDIGGQDSKAIRISETGSVLQFIMNDKCAAGTGRFLEVMARTLGIELERWGEYVASAETSTRISSVCTVFAETEIISKVTAGTLMNEILAGICDSIAIRVGQMAQRITIEKNICFTGGVASNHGVAQKIEGFLGKSVLIPQIPQSTGALGAAIIALREVEQ